MILFPVSVFLISLLLLNDRYRLVLLGHLVLELLNPLILGGKRVIGGRIVCLGILIGDLSLHILII